MMMNDEHAFNANQNTPSRWVVYLMRGLPSCGKSRTAGHLAGARGVICETDEYFYKMVGDDPESYDYRKELMQDARQWNYERFASAVRAGRSPIVVDRGNSRSLESQRYILYAQQHGYHVELREPESPWWQEIRLLLKNKENSQASLDQWAERLANMNRATHRTSAATIRDWMQKWKWDLTIEDIIQYKRQR